MLWRQGKESICIVDRKTFKVVNSISDFFVYKTTTTKPISACASRDAAKILAISQNPSNSRFILHYFECDEEHIERIRTKYIQRIYPEMSEACDLEVSADSSKVYVGGVNKFNGKAMLICSDFTKNLNIVSYTILDQLDFGKPRVIKRIKGYEILVVGCNYHYAIVQFKDFKFVNLACINDVHKSRILDFEYKNQLIFSIGENDNDLKVISFGKDDLIDTMNSPGSKRKAQDRTPRKKVQVGDQSMGLRLANEEYKMQEPGSVGMERRTKTPTKYEKSPDDAQAYQSGLQRNPSEAKAMMLSNPKNNQIGIKGLNGLEKIAVSYNGRRIYIGGKGLHIVQKGSKGTFTTVSKQELKELNYFSIKATNSKHVVIQENGSNDLVVLDKLGSEVTRLFGKDKLYSSTIIPLIS